MNDERSNGDGGRGHDDVDGFGGPEEPTVVVTSEKFIDRALARLPRGLRRLARRVSEYRPLMREAHAVPALEELRAEVRDIELIAAGIGRGLDRIIADAKKRERGEP